MNPRKIETVFDVSKKTVLITGASGYLGQEITRVFATNGSRIILMGRSVKIADFIRDLTGETGSSEPHFVQSDFYNRQKFHAAVDVICRNFDVDVLINNAYDMGPNTGFNTDKGRLENLEFEQWENAFQSGLYWAFYLSQKIGSTMRGRGGSIINVSSMYGVVSPDPQLYAGTSFFNPAPYGVMKAGLIAMTKYFASFWAEHNVRCNAVSPGPFSNTKTSSPNGVASNDPFLERVKNKTVLKRIGRPEELNGALLLLASHAGSYITGQNIIVDGGWTIT